MARYRVVFDCELRRNGVRSSNRAAVDAMIAADVQLGAGVVIHHPDLVNLYGCRIGPETRIGTFVEIQKGAAVGSRCKISSHTFVCEGVTIEDGVFVGHGVMFINRSEERRVGKEGRYRWSPEYLKNMSN